MKLIKGLKLKGSPAEIPNCSRFDLPEFFKEMGFETGAEIGVAKGEFSEKFAKAGLKLFAIDPWTTYGGAGRHALRQDSQDRVYEHAKKVLAPFKDCKIIRKTSMEAVKDFSKGSLDFVYIDGDHRFPFIAEDLYEWFRRVKAGGIVSGHDYFCTDPWAYNSICHVNFVVDAFVKAFRIKHFYIFGGSDSSDKEYFSWMFIKPDYKTDLEVLPSKKE